METAGLADSIISFTSFPVLDTGLPFALKMPIIHVVSVAWTVDEPR